MVKHLSTMWDTWVQSLDWEDSLEKEMATHSNILAWRIPWTEERARLQSMGLQRVRHDCVTFTFTHREFQQIHKTCKKCTEISRVKGKNKGNEI